MEIRKHPSFHQECGLRCRFDEWLIEDGYLVEVGDPIYQCIDEMGNTHIYRSKHFGTVTITGMVRPDGSVWVGDQMYTVTQVITPTPPKPCYVYLMHDTSNNFYKIGMSNDPTIRESTLQSEKPTIELLIAKKYPIRIIARNIEKALQMTYKNKNLRGEWFRLEEIDVKHLIETLS